MKTDEYHAELVRQVELRVAGWPRLRALAAVGLAKVVRPESVPEDVQAAAARLVGLIRLGEMRLFAGMVPLCRMTDLGPADFGSVGGGTGLIF